MNAHALLSLPRFLADHGGMLLLGTTVFLGAGTLAMRLQRSPVHRQRLGEITIACTLLWVVLACLPLPRVALWSGGTADPAAPRSRPEPLRRLILPESSTYRWENHAPVLAYAGPADVAVLTAKLDRELLTQYSDKLFPGNDTRRPAWVAALRGLANGGRKSTATSTPASDFPPLLATVYLAVACAIAAWLVLGNVLLARVVRYALRPPQWLRTTFDELSFDVRRRPRLLVSDRCRRPVSCGIFRPTVLLPAGCVRQGRLDQLRQVLLHEVGHVRQGDAVGNALLNLAMPLLYFHPLYWLLRADVHLARELVADDWAAGRSGKVPYVAELVALARSRLLPAAELQPGPAALGLFRSPTHFYRRMHMLMKRTNPLATRCSAAWRAGSAALSALALASAACVIGVRPAPAVAQDRAVVVDVKSAEKDESAAPSEDAKPREAVPHDLEAAKAQLEVARQNYERVKASQNEARNRLGQLDLEASRLKADSDKLAESTRLDGLLHEKLKSQSLKGEAPDDETFLRRLHLDVTGTLPDKDALNDFKSDKSPEKRKKAVDELLAKRAPDRWSSLTRSGSADRNGAPDTGAPADPFAGGGSGKVSAGPLDLIGLATSFSDAVGEVQLAKVRLAAAGEKSPTEEAVQRVALETAMRKAKLLRTIAEIALAGARAEYEDARKLSAKGFLPQSQMAETESKLKILELILSSDEAGDKTSDGWEGRLQRK
ncbi:MAG TPA: M56 family metallopeptidase [Tepidisphaeraceae bacterium]|nr:M56 family metallopeptidase [Tepidisphaeraceae bacterium]